MSIKTLWYTIWECKWNHITSRHYIMKFIHSWCSTYCSINSHSFLIFECHKHSRKSWFSIILYSISVQIIKNYSSQENSNSFILLIKGLIRWHTAITIIKAWWVVPIWTVVFLQDYAWERYWWCWSSSISSQHNWWKCCYNKRYEKKIYIFHWYIK